MRLKRAKRRPKRAKRRPKKAKRRLQEGQDEQKRAKRACSQRASIFDTPPTQKAQFPLGPEENHAFGERHKRACSQRAFFLTPLPRKRPNSCWGASGQNTLEQSSLQGFQEEAKEAKKSKAA